MQHPRVVVVTGASSGIGLGLAQAAVGRGDAVYGLARHAAARGPAQAEHVTWLDANVADPAQVKRAFELVSARYGRVDLVVNNAGVFVSRAFGAYAESDFDALVDTNLRGFFNVTRAALEVMTPRRSGHVVSITTSLVSQPFAKVPAALPLLTKGGIEAATRALALEYAAQGVRFNAVAPGIIDTPMHPPENHAFLQTLSPAGRLGSVREVVDAVLYLDSAPYVTGEVLRVDGGAHAGVW